MRIHDVINKALVLVGELEQVAGSAGKKEEVALWQHLHEHVLFIIRTGQVYRFEDYLASIPSARISYVSDAFRARNQALSQQAMALLLQTLDRTTESERSQVVLAIINMLNFMAATGQYDAFDDYLSNYYEDAPWVVAHFDTREEADRWLNSLVEPPSWAYVLIGDEYFEVWYSREDGERKLRRDSVIEYILEDFAKKGLPPAVASFNSGDEAREWLSRHPASPMVFVTVSGEPYLAVFHKKFNHHTLHPLSSLEEWRAEER